MFLLEYFLVQNLQALAATALVAGSPIRHESSVVGHAVEVHTYPPWKALSEFALHSDLDQPAFQQLVSKEQKHPPTYTTQAFCTLSSSG